MIRMTEWISQAGEPMRYYSKERDTEEACESLIRDTMIPLQFGRQCRNSGEFTAEKESEEGNPLRWRNQKANEVQIGSKSQEERERWRSEQIITRTFKDLETLKENEVIVLITDAAGRIMPKPAMARIGKIDMNGTDISDQTAEAQTQIEETEAPAQPDPTPRDENQCGKQRRMLQMENLECAQGKLAEEGYNSGDSQIRKTC